VEISAGTRYPTAVSLKVNALDGYVKDMRLGWDTINATGTAITHAPTYTGWATGYSGTLVNLQCADQEVVTGVQLRYDTTNGKIRRLNVFCRQFAD
jgi:hypothetical protein